MRLAFVLNALAAGGAEIHTVSLARSLASRGHDCMLMPLIDAQQIPVHGIATAKIGGNDLFGGPARRLKSALAEFQPDLIVATNGRPTALVQLAKIGAQVTRMAKVVTIYHTTVMMNNRQRIQHVIHTPFINRSDALVFVSKNQERYCSGQNLHGRKKLTIHNGVDVGRFNPDEREYHRSRTRADLRLRDSDFVIGQAAAFRPEKNHAQSLQALKSLIDLGRPAYLLLVGDGPERRNIERLATRLGVRHRVIFTGRQIDVIPWLSAFDIGILTSTAIETFSLAALEIMALGIPMVLSDIGGADEMVRDGSNGRLFEVGNTSALTDCLIRLHDPAIRESMGKAAASRVVEQFSAERMVSDYETLFYETITAAPGDRLM